MSKGGGARGGREGRSPIPTTPSPSLHWRSRSPPTRSSASSPTSACTPGACRGGRAHPQRDDRQDRARRAHPDDARQRPPRRSTRSSRADIRGRRGHQAGHDRRQPCARPDAPLLLEPPSFAEPVIKVAVEPKTKSDQEKMSVALGRLAEEDPTFRVQSNEETGQTEISGNGRTAPRGAGRPDEAPRFNVRGECRPPAGLLPRDHPAGPPRRSRAAFVKQTGGSGPVRHRLHQHRAGAGRGLSTSSTRSRAASVPSEFIPAVEKGCEEALSDGVKAGYPMVERAA